MSSDFSFGASLTIAFSFLSYRVARTDRQCQFLGISGDLQYDVAVKNCDGIESKRMVQSFFTKFFEVSSVPVDFIVGFGFLGISRFTILRRLEVVREPLLTNVADGDT